MAGVISLYFISFLVVTLVFYFLGAFLLRLLGYKEDHFYATFFYRSLTGLVVSVLLFSLFATSFKTIQWGILIVGLFMWYEFKRTSKEGGRTFVRAKQSESTTWRPWIPLLILAAVVFGWFAYFTFSWQGDFMYAIPHKDKGYYSNISTALVEFGFENRQGAYYPEGIGETTEPYHYFDLWLTAMLSFFIGKPAVLSVSLLNQPVCALITMIGILSVFEMKGRIKIWHYVLVFLLVFIRGLYLEIKDPQIAWAENFTESVMEFKSEKLGVLYLLAVFSFRLFLSGDLFPALSSLLVLPVISIGNSVGVIGGLLLFVIIMITSSKTDRRGAFRISLYCLSIAGFIYGFYRITGGETVYLDKGPLVFTDMKQINFHFIKVAFVELCVRVMHNPWRTALMHLPFLVLAGMTIRGNKYLGRAFLLTGCIYLASLAGYGLFYKLADSPQFYTNNLPLVNVFLIIGAALFIADVHGRTVRLVLSAGLVVILGVMIFFSISAYRESRSFTELYSDKYLCEIDSIHGTMHERENIAVLYDPSRKPDLYNCDMSGPNLLYQPLFSKFRVPVDLNVFENRELTWGGEMGEVQKRFLRRAPFRRFVLGQVIDGSFSDLKSSQFEYLKNEHIRYLFVSAGIEPGHNIVSIVKRRIVDKRSGEQLLILNSIP